VFGDKGEAVGSGRFIDEIIDVALAIDRDLPGPVTRHRHIPHQPEQRMQLLRSRVRVFDELKAVSTHGIVGADHSGRRIVRKWTHR
jgi:hypothetical protein